MIGGSIRPQQDPGLFRRYLGVGDDPTQEYKGCYRVGECIVPAEARKYLAKVVFEAQIHDEVTQRKGFLVRPDRARKLQGIHPWAKTMKGKCAQETSLGGGAVSDEPSILEQSMNFGPELRQARRSGEILGADSVDFLRRPSDWLIREDEARELFGNDEPVHQRDADLHGHFGTAPSNARAFKVDGGKRSFADHHAVGAV